MVEQNYYILKTYHGIPLQKSALTLVTTCDTKKRVELLGCKNIEVCSEASLSLEEIEKISNISSPKSHNVIFISIGRLLHWKGFYLGLEAFSKAKIEGAEYWIIGSGPEEDNLRKLVTNFNMETKVVFWGELSREKTLEKLGQAHVLVHPSLHDSGGWVCLEGMAAGKPVICLDLGGPSVQVTQDTGMKITAINPEQTIIKLSEAMVVLYNDKQKREGMGNAGKKLVREKFNWTKKGEHISQLYKQFDIE